LQEVDELAEDQRLVAVGDEFAGEFGKGLHLGAGDAEFRAAQARVAGGAAQARQLREDVEAGLRFGRTLERGVDLARGLAAQGFVMRGFGASGATVRISSVRGGSSCSTSDLVRRRTKGPIRRLRTCCASRSRLRSIGPGEALVEAVDGAEQAGVGKTHDRPEVGQAVFDRRAGQRQAKIGVEFEHRLRALGGGVLDRLRFVGDQGMPGAPAKRSCASCSSV
jgi:hypothetical protein